MLQILAIFIALSSFFCSFAAAGQNDKDVPPKHADFSALALTGTVTLSQIIDGLHFSVSTGDGQDAQTIRLSGIHIPGIDGNPSSAEAEKAKTLWHDILQSGEKLHLYQTTNARKGRMNRMGHHLAHIVRARDRLWLQGALLDRGLAYALPSRRNPEMAAAMYAREEPARDEKHGLWQGKAFHIRSPETAGSDTGKFVFVSGRITDVAETYSRTYLNFGEDWKTDFTISIDKTMAKNMTEDGVDLIKLKHRMVRVRGWLEDWNGPHIKLYTPEHLEILPERP